MSATKQKLLVCVPGFWTVRGSPLQDCEEKKDKPPKPSGHKLGIKIEEIQQLLPNSLSNEVANNTAIINVHPRPIGVENPGNSDFCRHTQQILLRTNHKSQSSHRTKRAMS
jgi:hypothetical protein